MTQDTASSEPQRQDGDFWNARLRCSKSYAFVSLINVSWGWPNKLQRVSRMSGKELRTRVQQQSSKLWDLASYGFGSKSLHLSSLPRTTNEGLFFWKPGDQLARARMVQLQTPAEAQAILREADQICAHWFNLLGYEQLTFGEPIDWHRDPVHGKQSPLKPWFNIAFLKFSEVGDHKIIWELNRHQHMVTLAKAYLLSGDSRYAQEVVKQWRHWRSANPYPLGINWASSLEVAFRALSWIWIDHLLPSLEFHAFRDELLGGLDFSGRYIERYLSTYFSPNTHLLGEAAALFFLGMLYPDLPRARKWRGLGWEILTEQAGEQVHADGVYFEQSLHYHVYALDLFLHSRQLAHLNGVAIADKFDTALRRMLGVVQALAQAGPPEGFGDDDGGRLFNPRRNRTEHMTDPLALGSLIYSDDFSSARLTEEALWLFGETAIERFPRQPEQRSISVSSQAFTEGGIYVMGGGLPYPHQMVIDAGPQGTGNSGHGHADALSIRLSGNGQRWLVDSGSAVYVGADQTLRDRLRGTAAHNTLVVDGMDQSERVNPFSWRDLANSRVEQWISGRGFTLLSASHNGYMRLRVPVRHERFVFGLDDGVYLIRDSVTGNGRHSLEVNWHFAPEVRVDVRGNIAAATLTGSADCMSLLFAHQGDWIHERIDGIHSPVYGCTEVAPLVKIRATLETPTEIGTILALSSKELATAQLSTYTGGAVRAYEYRAGESTYYFFFHLRSGMWEYGEWSSNGTFLYVQLIGTELVDLVLLRGSAVARRQQPLISVAAPLDWYSWRKRGGIASAASSGTHPPPLLADITTVSTLAPIRP
jgi:Heparinase II/III-like protein/Heparinase II/III N-terminus